MKCSLLGFGRCWHMLQWVDLKKQVKAWLRFTELHNVRENRSTGKSNVLHSPFSHSITSMWAAVQWKEFKLPILWSISEHLWCFSTGSAAEPMYSFLYPLSMDNVPAAHHTACFRNMAFLWYNVSAPVMCCTCQTGRAGWGGKEQRGFGSEWQYLFLGSQSCAAPTLIWRSNTCHSRCHQSQAAVTVCWASASWGREDEQQFFWSLQQKQTVLW